MSVVMMLAPLRYYKNIKFVNHGFFALGHGGINPGCKAYSKDKGSCCKDVSQTEGKKIELWPKADSPPVAWRAECPRGPQPPNYDPYRIKVPDVVVPPLPPSNAKRSGVVLTSTEQGARTGTPAGPHAGPRAAPDHRDHDDDDPEHYQQSAPPDDPKHGGFMGLLRGLFDRLKGKSKGGSDAMITGQACPLALPIPIIEELQENALMEIPNEDARELFRNPEIQYAEPAHGDLFHNSPIVHPDYWKDKTERKLNNVEEPRETLPKLGYHGRSKYKYAFHEPWKPLDRMTLLEQAAKRELDTEEERAAAVKTEK